MASSGGEHGGGNWFESEALWERFFSFMFTDAHFTAAVENVPKIVALTGVTGVDRTRFLLDKARERATQAGATVEWVQQDMREFVRPDAFELALNVYTSFGYFDDPAENRRVLENILASLKPGGTFVFEHISKELLAGRFQPTQADTLTDGSVMIQRRNVIDDWSRIDVEWIILEGANATSFRLRHWLYSAREIRDLFASVGFNDIAIYGGFDGSPYGPQATRLVAVARKPRA